MVCLAWSARAAPEGQIALVLGDDQDTQRVAVHDLATQQTMPVGPGHCDGAPQWSPDGSRLAFQTKDDGKLLVYVVNADGSGGRVLKHGHDWNQEPRWSPDGKRLAYTVSVGDGPETAVAVYDLDTDTESLWGGEQPGLMRPVFLPSTLLLLALQPDATEKGFDNPIAEGLRKEALAPDARGILLSAGAMGAQGRFSTELFVATPGFALPLLPLVPNCKDSIRYAEWYAEPNAKGDRLAFETNDGGDREIFVLGKRGLANVSNNAAADWAPAWSPDGKSLAFESFRGGRRGVYRCFTDTARVLPVLAPADAQAFAPAWSPDGKSIACTSTESGRPQVVVVELKSGKAIRIACDAPSDAAAWLPAKRGK